MANPTTNYGFVLPTATDLVTDLPADFDVALQGVDTRLKALQPGTTLGDLAYSSATANTNTRLGVGTNGQVLAVSGGVPAWTTTSDVTPLTTKGDLFTFTTVDARLGIGANNTVLTADSAEATGMKWATPAAGSYTAIVAETSFGSVTSVVISSIPSTYKNLVLILNSVSFDNTDRVLVRPNSSGANQPSSTMVEGTTGETVTTSAKAQWQINLTTLSAAGTNNSWSCQFPNYASSGAKYMNFNGAYVSTASSCSIMGSTAWFNTTAISSLQIKSESGYTFDSGTYALYGVN
jgi:hypothetical protein